MNMSLFGMIPLLVLAAVAVAVGQRGEIVDVGMPGGAVVEVVAETPVWWWLTCQWS